MSKPYGFRGEILPKSAADKLIESFIIDDVEVSIKEGLFEVGYDKPENEKIARQIVQHLINSWRQRNNLRINVEFNQSWRPSQEGNKHYSISLHDSIKISDRLTITTVITKGMSYIIKPHSDSYSFSNDIKVARKAMKDKTLADTLRFYGEEVVDNKRPLYGIYKAIEVITKQLGKDGRKKLGILAGKNEAFVYEVMQTAQIQRHAFTPGKRKLSDQECKERANTLIASFAASLSE